MLWRMDKPERFIEQIKWTCEEEDENGCWIWPECPDWDKSQKRRPVLKINRKKMPVARWVLWAVTGELQDQARHKCDVGCCCNPDHLVWGTTLENIRDCVERGRNSFGERNGRSKLTEDDVREIRLRHSQGESQGRLGPTIRGAPSDNLGNSQQKDVDPCHIELKSIVKISSE